MTTKREGTKQRSMNNLLVLTSDADDYCKLLEKQKLAELEFIASKGGDDAKEKIRNSNIVLGEPGLVAAVLHEAKCLQWVQSTFAGIELLCAEGLRKNYILTGVKGVYGPVISEYVFAYILALERHLFETRENQKHENWTIIPYRRLKDLTLGVCGFGSIGRHVAQTAAHFGMQVIAYKRTPDDNDSPFIQRVYTGSSFGEFLGLSDYLVSVLPNTPETTGLIDYRALKQMKPSAVLLNAGRGNAIVETDLVRALKENVIHSAVLDVFQEEPLPQDSELWALPNALVTPHNSGFGFPKDIIQVFFDNYQRFLKKQSLQYVIHFERGY
jgi:phosphoglycerate dehydrogenase-like enzyme